MYRRKEIEKELARIREQKYRQTKQILDAFLKSKGCL